MRKWLRAVAATCGAWVTAMTWTLPGEAREALADRVRDRAADAGVDFVEDEGRRRALVRQHHLEGQHEAGQLAARRHLHQRARPGARIGLGPELDALEAAGVAAGLVGVKFR